MNTRKPGLRIIHLNHLCDLQLKRMSREEYAELLYGSDSAKKSMELQRARTEMESNEHCRESNTTIINKILWGTIAAAQRTTAEHIRRAGNLDLQVQYFFLIIRNENK